MSETVKPKQREEERRSKPEIFTRNVSQGRTERTINTRKQREKRRTEGFSWATSMVTGEPGLSRLMWQRRKEAKALRESFLFPPAFLSRGKKMSPVFSVERARSRRNSRRISKRGTRTIGKLCLRIEFQEKQKLGFREVGFFFFFLLVFLLETRSARGIFEGFSLEWKGRRSDGILLLF